MYDKVSTNLNFVEREKKVEKFWEENQIFEKSIESRKQGETYTFYEWRYSKWKAAYWSCSDSCYQRYDSRYRTMKGYMVPRKAGWDTHGLPVELEVEKRGTGWKRTD